MKIWKKKVENKCALKYASEEEEELWWKSLKKKKRNLDENLMLRM